MLAKSMNPGLYLVGAPFQPDQAGADRASGATPFRSAGPSEKNSGKGTGNKGTYETLVPFVIACPNCGGPHQTRAEMAECLLKGPSEENKELGSQEKVLECDWVSFGTLMGWWA